MSKEPDGISRPTGVLGADDRRRHERKGGTMHRIAALGGALAFLAAAFAVASTVGETATASPQDAGKVVFFSNQLAQVSEVNQVRNTLLKGFNGNVDYIVPPVGQPQVFFNRVEAEAQAGRGTISLPGPPHGEH